MLWGPHIADVAEWIDVWRYAERYLGGGTRAYSRFAADLDLGEPYHPQRGLPSFDLPTWWVPDDRGEFITNALSRSASGRLLCELYRGPGGFLLPVHPETVATLEAHDPQEARALRALTSGPPVGVVPSANGRTVFVHSIGGQPVPAHFVKLHYPRRLSRFTRRLRRPIIDVQLWVADELTRIGVPVLPEVGAGVVGTDPRSAWGFLLRAISLSDTPRWTVPLFALYGSDLRALSQPTLVEQLIWHSGQSAEEFLIARVIRPMVRLWLAAARGTGCALEMHGQNTLFCFSDDLAGSQIIYRDCGIYVDPAIRSALGLPADLPATNVISRDVTWPRAQVFSLTYDSFLGHHALGGIARLAALRLGVAETTLQAAAREEFARASGGDDLLPATVYYYDDALHPDGGWRLVDTGTKPLWR